MACGSSRRRKEPTPTHNTTSTHSAITDPQEPTCREPRVSLSTAEAETLLARGRFFEAQHPHSTRSQFLPQLKNAGCRILTVCARVRFFFRFGLARIHTTNPRVMGYASTAVLSLAPRTVSIFPARAILVVAQASQRRAAFPRESLATCSKSKKKRKRRQEVDGRRDAT